MKVLRLLCLSMVCLTVAVTPARGNIAKTKHNLLAGDSGYAKTGKETRICIFCHTPHTAAPTGPLWNRQDSGSTYIPYSSSTAKASPGQPTGSSILCLSCHDGTIALGQVLNETLPLHGSGGPRSLLPGPSILGTDLSDDHPVSFKYKDAIDAVKNELAEIMSLKGPVHLDKNGEIQCTTCHDAHDDTFGKFLVMSNRGSALCITCHIKNYWNQSSHKTSTKTWNGVNPDPWPHTPWATVADNGCENCHRPHSAGGYHRLLNFAVEEENCYTCHNGNVAQKNIQAEFNKSSTHPVMFFTGIHDPEEPSVITERHVECVDCHNPHASKPFGGTPSGATVGVRGIGVSGTDRTDATFEYEICYRCHGDSPQKPPPRTPRQISQTNVRLEFSTANPSFHPVEGVGRNSYVPSLIAPYTTRSILNCSDCHNNDKGPNAGGTGPDGPHGSAFTPLLERQYITTDNTSENSTTYALCYKCHSRNSILNNESFKYHYLHIVSENTPCSVCHDAHGISYTQGSTRNNSNLINFDTSVVYPNSGGRLEYISQGTYKGVCYLKCHGHNHAPTTPVRLF